MNGTSKIFVFIAAGIVAALGGALLARNVLHSVAAPPALSSGTIIQPPRNVPDFSLIDQDGKVFNIGRLRDHWTLMFFGFTNCGDVCPTTLTLLAAVNRQLEKLPPSTQPAIVFVSVDSQRDSPARLKKYLSHFDARFVGVTGEQKALDAFTLSLGVPSSIRPLDSGYAVDHSSSILAFNPHGQFQALFSAPHTIGALTKDYQSLVGLRQ